MNLQDLGYTAYLEQWRKDNKLDGFEVGRVIAEHKERYIIKTAEGEYEAEITGNMRFAAKSREDFPALGDWVALTTYESDFAIIHHIYPRHAVIKRKAVGQFGEVQIIATNVDFAWLVQAIDRDFNINRLERYLTICHAARVQPIIVLTKIDLIDEAQVQQIIASIKGRINHIEVFALSSETLQGYEAIQAAIQKGKTYCMLGSSGVGKSTLLNKLSGKTVMKTDAISQSTHKGRHITSHRELLILDNGGLLIDNPGMREVGMADTTEGLEATFDQIVRLAQQCKFKDCTHTNEIGCAVLEAVEREELDARSYENFMKMERENAHFESSAEERRKKDKEFGKFVKNYKKDMKKNKGF